jgi:hypothetical protein
MKSSSHPMSSTQARYLARAPDTAGSPSAFICSPAENSRSAAAYTLRDFLQRRVSSSTGLNSLRATTHAVWLMSMASMTYACPFVSFPMDRVWKIPAWSRLRESLDGIAGLRKASTTLPSLCAGADVFVVGGGNSAGQAARHFSASARRVSLLIRGRQLSSTLSQYLLDRISSTPNIEVLPQTSIAELHGDDCLEGINIMDGVTKSIRYKDARWLMRPGIYSLDPISLSTESFPQCGPLNVSPIMSRQASPEHLR